MGSANFSTKKYVAKPLNVRPIQDRVIIKQDEADNVSKGGIIIPDPAKEPPLFGTVVAVGPGKVNEKGETRPIAVKTGDRVLFSKYAGTDIKIDGGDYMMMKEDDLLGVVEEDDHVEDCHQSPRE